MASVNGHVNGELTDKDLVMGCRRGEEAAWEQLVSRYERLVYTIPIRYGLTPSEVDDVFQSVWMALIKHIETLRRPDRIGAWLVTTARRECWERRRGADFKRTVSSSLETLLVDRDGGELTPEEVVAVFRQHEALREAIECLDERCRKLLWHLYYDSTIPSYAEIAEKMDMPIGSIGPLRARCLKKLRKILSESAAEASKAALSLDSGVSH
jgi:RNA polymerase sigma factor (sigma-70 family)